MTMPDRSLRPHRARHRAAPVLLLAALLSGAVATTSPARADSSEDLSRLRERFKQALTLEEAGSWQQALTVFDEIAKTKPTAAVVYHQALCHENLGRIQTAAVLFAEAAQRAPAEGDLAQDIPEKADRRRQALLPRIPKLRIRMAPDATGTVVVNGEVWPTEDLGKEIEKDPGDYEVKVRRVGSTTRLPTVSLPESTTREVIVPAAKAVSLTPKPETPPPPPSEGGSKAPAIVVGSVGMAAVVSSAVMVALRQVAVDEVTASCKDNLTECDPALRVRADQGQDFHFAAIGLAAGGVACLGAAAALWFTIGADPDPAPPTAKPAAAVSVFLRGTHAGVHVRF